MSDKTLKYFDSTVFALLIETSPAYMWYTLLTFFEGTLLNDIMVNNLVTSSLILMLKYTYKMSHYV